MQLTLDKIADALSSASGSPVSPIQVRPAGETDVKDQVADATSKFVVQLDRTDGFLIISGAGNPALVRRAVTKIEMAKSMLGPAGDVILPPILSGDVDGLTFAVWERQKPFPDGRIGRRLTRWLYSYPILDWGLALCASSLRSAKNIEDQYVCPLLAIRDDTSWPSDMRRDASVGIERIGVWRPMQCIQHGDFWIGNVLRSKGRGFYVIDWAGANICGYPVFDITRMLMSLNCSSRTKERYMNRLCAILSCDKSDLVSYALAALGSLGANLEHFPIEQYRRMSIAVHRHLVGV